ncbi:uncharacterized protein LOC114804696 [Zeugodacus cucurbitae]|uniref:uncharacterized protein LOC114804696 n=1 Tax=Zeugodacus cucurbitae TaxID=28588 RepID=UPI0010A7463B|nr:uncharacterized protein LOC114804696 [Zeugodacus cucurbitae]
MKNVTTATNTEMEVETDADSESIAQENRETAVPANQVGDTVDKIRKTFTLSKGSADISKTLHKTITEILQDDAKIFSTGPEKDLEIRDICGRTAEAIKIRKTFRGTQTASVTLTAATAQKVVGEYGKKRIGWKIVTALFPQQHSFDYQLTPCELDDVPPVTEEELLDACNRVGNNKAPGLDGIPNIALKIIIKAAPTLFLNAYNACPKEGIFLRKWKQQRLVLLPKGKKPPEEPSSHLPLCILDTAGKIFERIFHQRIDTVIDPLLADNQYGFRKGSSGC